MSQIEKPFNNPGQITKSEATKIFDVKHQIISIIGKDGFQETLKSYSSWAKVGDNVYGAAVWTILMKRDDLNGKEMEDLYQTYSQREFQRKLSGKLGLLTERQLLLGSITSGDKTPSELFEAIIGRIYMTNNPDHKIPVDIVESTINLLNPEDRKPMRLPGPKFEHEYPGYKLLVGPADEKGKKSIKIYDPQGGVIVEITSRKTGSGIRTAIDQARKVINKK